MRISDWSSDVCSSDLLRAARQGAADRPQSQDGRRGAHSAAPRDDLSRQPDDACPRRGRLTRNRPMSDHGEAEGKGAGAMLSIGELAERIGVPTHVLRYWETRFPQLKPLQRSGRRRYYRVEDVALAERIHHLLHVQGFTVEGARKALAGRGDDAAPPPAAPGGVPLQADRKSQRLKPRH